MIFCLVKFSFQCEDSRKRALDIPGFGYFQNNIISEPVTNSPMFIAAVFPTVKTWMQPKCSSMDGWIKKMLYIYIRGFPGGANSEEPTYQRRRHRDAV